MIPSNYLFVCLSPTLMFFLVVPCQLSNGETRTVLRLKRRVAPVKAAVLPLVKNSSDIMAAAQEVYALLRKR